MRGVPAAMLLPAVLCLLLLAGACSDPSPPAAGSRETGAAGTSVAALSLAGAAAPTAREVPRGEWLRVESPAGTLPGDLAASLRLACDGRAWPFAVEPLSARTAVVDPAGQLPAAARCELSWSAGSFVFDTAAGEAAAVPYAPVRDARPHAFPDDFFTEPDASTATGLRLALPTPEVMGAGVASEALWAALAPELAGLDGFSPIAHLVFELPAPLDADSVPLTPAESLDPLASVALLDLDPASPRYGSRVPFRLALRDDVTPAGRAAATALVFPSVPLEPGGRYGLVVSRRARIDSGRSLGPSPTLAAALTPPRAGEREEVARIRELLAPLLAVSEGVLEPAIRRDDVALALRFSVRSLDALPGDLLDMREQVAAAAAPEWWIEAIEPVDDAASSFAAIVHGRWRAPDWRVEQEVARDEAGRPRITGHQTLSFTLALPRSAADTPAPVVLYQHGNPGSAEQEVAGRAQRGLAEAGLALIGVNDVLVREVAARSADPETALAGELLSLLLHVLERRRIPDYWLETTGEQLAFLRVVSQLGQLDVLPWGAPDGVPDLDVSAPLGLLGVSQGANQAPALLAYAPEIRAAVLVGAGARSTEMLMHQRADLLLDTLSRLFPDLAPTDVWLAMALFQTALDRQDAHNHARFVSDPHVLLIAGLGDSLVPNHASDSLAAQLGLPVLEPDAHGVAFLESAPPPLQGNLARGRTGAYVRFVPRGAAVGALPTPGCLPPALSESEAREGHFCAQLAEESQRLRTAFLRAAASGAVPVVVAP